MERSWIVRWVCREGKGMGQDTGVLLHVAGSGGGGLVVLLVGADPLWGEHKWAR